MCTDARHCVDLALRSRELEPGFLLLRRFTVALVRLGCSLFELSPVEPHSPSFDVTSLEGSGKLDHITSRWSGRTARAALVSNIPPRREASWAVTPVFVDQCQQSTILFSRWAPFVPAHFATCFPHVALALGFMPIEPASMFVSASCGPFPPTQRFHAYRACFVTCVTNTT